MIPGHKKVFLHPGQFYFTSDPIEIHTILGTCVAITLWHPEKKFGGMCHFVLSHRPQSDQSEYPNGRYGNEVLELFRRHTSARGTHLQDYQAKVFGGGQIIQREGNASTIGQRNANFALSVIESAKVNLKASDLRGKGYRRIIFDIETGNVWVRHQYAEDANCENTG